MPYETLHTNKELFQDRIGKPLTTALGKKLTQIFYCPLQSEFDIDQINDNDLYIGGEILLFFNSSYKIFISWDEDLGWDTHFSIGVAQNSFFSPGTLGTYDANQTSLWSGVIGKQLMSVKCYGWENSPHIIEFCFDGQTRFIGSAHETTFDEGDDIFFCKEQKNLRDAQFLWGKKC